MNEIKWSRSSRQMSRVGLPSVFQHRSVVVLILSKSKKSSAAKPGGGDLLVTHSA
jgi:hypothetical protein